MQFKSLRHVLEHFKEEKTCIEFLEQQRWGGKPCCPHCEKSTKPYIIEEGKRYKCDNKVCHKKFSVTVGTIFENSKVKLSEWFVAIYLCTSRKKGVSSYQLADDIGVTQKTAFFMLHRIREMLKENAPEMLTEPTQIDELYHGGKARNKRKKDRIFNTQGRSTKTKTPIFGLLSDGKVYTRVVPDTAGKTLKPIIFEMVAQGTILISDEWKAYRGLGKYFERQVVKHKADEYVNAEGYSTNALEGYWGGYRRTIMGTHHQISKKHLQRYSDEIAFRYNTRKETSGDRFSNTLLNSEHRLTYKQLIGKT